jgi:HK97 family phage prohead protease
MKRQGIIAPSYRYIPEKVLLREADTKKSIGGYAAKFDTETNLGWMTESVAKDAFSDVLGNDVRCLFNHDPNQILGRTTSGTLTIEQDDTGLKYDNEMSMTSPVSIHVMDSISRGDVNQSSFAFTIKEHSWDKRKSAEGFEYYHRTIIKVETLYDVSPVVYPAYEDATVEELGKSLEDFITREMPEELQHMKEVRSKFLKEEIDILHEQLEAEASERARKIMGLRMKALKFKLINNL